MWIVLLKNPFVKNTSLPDIHTRFSAWRSSFFPSHQRPTFGWGVFVPSVVCSTPQRSPFLGGTGIGSLPCPKLTQPRRRSVLWHPFSVCRQWRGTSILETGGWGSRSAQSLRISSVWKIGHRWRTQPRSGRNGPWGQAGFAHIQWHLWAREGQVMITTVHHMSLLTFATFDSVHFKFLNGRLKMKSPKRIIIPWKIQDLTFSVFQAILWDFGQSRINNFR